MSKQINTAIEALSGVIELVILGYDAEAMADDIKIKQLQTKNDTLRTALTETRKLWGIIHGQYKSGQHCVTNDAARIIDKSLKEGEK